GRRTDAIDADDKITLVNDADNEMFNVDDLGGEEVFVVEQEVVSTAATTKTITIKEITLAQALEALKTSKPKAKGSVFHEPEKAELKGISNVSTQVMETILDKEEVAIDAIPLAVKFSRIVDWKIHKEGKKVIINL
nr:hypothetical protein [Tanacetum cinerariifolium]